MCIHLSKGKYSRSYLILNIQIIKTAEEPFKQKSKGFYVILF